MDANRPDHCFRRQRSGPRLAASCARPDVTIITPEAWAARAREPPIGLGAATSGQRIWQVGAGRAHKLVAPRPAQLICNPLKRLQSQILFIA